MKSANRYIINSNLRYSLMSTINQDYVTVVKETNGHYYVDKVQIQKSDYLRGIFEDAVKNPDKMLFDFEAMFFDHYEDQSEDFYFVTPYGYKSSYVNEATKPEPIGNTENLNSILEDLYSDYDLLDPQTYKACIKKLYVRTFKRYILQSDLSKALKQIRNYSSVKMYSHDYLGWKHMEFALSDDVKIYVDTNFGYGFSSYFILTVSYKDIIITPLSHIVNYYYANVVDMLQCTRSYIVDHNSWEHALKFAAEFANQARNAPGQFVKNYLIHEVEEMMSGLRRIKRDPRAALESMMGRNYPEDLSTKTLRFVSDIPKWDIESFKAYGREFPIVFMAEKLTSALDTIEKLEKIGEFSPKLIKYQDEIYAMNKDILPLLTSTCEIIEKEIEGISNLISAEGKLIIEIKDELKELVDEKKNLANAIKPFEDMKKEATAKLKSQEEKDEFKHKYEEENSDYKKMLQNLKECKSKINNLNKNIDEHSNALTELIKDKGGRTSLVERLNMCKKKIEQTEKNVA